MDLIVFEIIVGSILTGIIAFMFWKMKQFDGEDYVTRKEAKEMIETKTDPIVDKLSEVGEAVGHIHDSVQSVAVSVARIDERTKRNHG